MFVEATREIHDCVYGVMTHTLIPPDQIAHATGSGFMIAPGVLVTAAHLCHVGNLRSNPIFTEFQVIRGPEIGVQPLERASFIAEHPYMDIALLRIDAPRANDSVRLSDEIIPTGRSVGSLGFPMSNVTINGANLQFNAFERFQGAHISAFRDTTDMAGRHINYYEVDGLMYPGSSGCPGFLTDGTVVGMQVMTLNENAINPNAPQNADARTVSISLWVTAEDIRDFAIDQGVMFA